MLTNIMNLCLSLFFTSGIIYRISVILSYSIIISICEEMAYYIISHFTDITIQFDSLPEIVFTSISLVSDLLILLIIMILHVIRKQKAGIKSKNIAFYY